MKEYFAKIERWQKYVEDLGLTPYSHWTNSKEQWLADMEMVQLAIENAPKYRYFYRKDLKELAQFMWRQASETLAK